MADATTANSIVYVPRIAIKFCTQCKWNLRAAYFAQELLQTFSTSIGEVALIPATGGIFTVTIVHAVSSPGQSTSDGTGLSTSATGEAAATAQDSPLVVQETILWDRKVDGGFPETKELKNRVRNIIEPNRDLGHIDRSLKKGKNKDENPVEVTKIDDDKSSALGGYTGTGDVAVNSSRATGGDPAVTSKSKNSGLEDGTLTRREDCLDCK